ncbi:MAG: CAP domain-containing protein [Pseudomonadota bacterium]
MRIILPSFMLVAALGLSADALAQATRSDELVSLINAYRAAPGSCGGERMAPVSALAPHPALVKIRIGRGTLLENALERAGFLSDHAEAIYISGASDAVDAMATIRQQYCSSLLSNQVSSIGAIRIGNDWQVVLAQQLLPVTPPDLGATGQALLAAVNAARARPRVCGSESFAPAPALRWNAELGAAALAHSSDMARQKYFSHEGKDGSQVGDRAKLAGYAWRRISENIAVGMPSAQEAMAGWLASPGHCANIMNRELTEMGAAFAINNDRGSRFYWTQVFGTAR